MNNIQQQSPYFLSDTVLNPLHSCNSAQPVKLIEFCKALNTNYQNGHYISCAILIRGILDYIPTIFGFASVVSLYSEISGHQSFKKSLEDINSAIRNVADDAMHNPANKNEVIKVEKMTIDNQQANLMNILEAVIRQLNNEDLRDLGNQKLQEKRMSKPTVQKTQLQLFEKYIEEEDWYMEFLEDKEIWICKKDNLYQIHNLDDYSDFSEPWTKVYPDKNGSGKHSVSLIYNNSLIRKFIFVYCDGGRISVAMPEIELDKTNNDEEKDNRKFFWVKDSLGYKLTNLIGSFYIYNNIEGIARMSNIQIKSLK